MRISDWSSDVWSSDLGFRSHWEANTGYSYKGANTSIAVVYANYPSVTGVTGTTPKNGQTGPRAPKMQATGSTDSGTSPQYRYKLDRERGGEGQRGSDRGDLGVRLIYNTKKKKK